jgi:hypothetical protein
VNAYAEPVRNLVSRVTAFSHLLNRCNLKFVRVPLSTHSFSLSLELWLRTVYETVVDSVRGYRSEMALSSKKAIIEQIRFDVQPPKPKDN